jgi:hypothetical protein
LPFLLPAIASPPGIARLQPRRTGRSGEAGGEERQKALSLSDGSSCLQTQHNNSSESIKELPGEAIKLLFSAAGGLNFLPSFWEGRKTKDKSSQSCRSCRTRSTQGPCFNTPNAHKFMTLRLKVTTGIEDRAQTSPDGKVEMKYHF